MKKTRNFAAVLAILFMYGCASAGTCKLDFTSGAKLSNTGNLLVNVECQDAEAERERYNIENKIVEKLTDLKVFKKVFSSTTAGDETPDLKLNVVVTRIKRVSKSARFWLGSGAGRGRIIADVEVFDLQANRKIAQAVVEGVTSGGTAFAGTTEEAIAEFAVAMSNFFRDNILPGVTPESQPSLPETTSPGNIAAPAAGN